MSESIKLRTQHQAHCKDCSLASLCLPLSLNMEDMDALDEIVKRGRPLKKGEFLFRQGDPFASVYAVRSGAKCSKVFHGLGVAFDFPQATVLGVDEHRTSCGTTIAI